jgi:malonyl-CoA/methylmalonyl-CoA synthetase
MSENLYATFQSRFPADQNQVFLERPDGRTLSYADLVDISGRLANVLKELGVKPGDRVAAQVEKSAEALMLYLASMRAGAVYLPLNTAYTAGEIRYFLGDAEPTLFVCSPQGGEEKRALARQLGVAHVETLGSKGDGSLMDRARAAVPEFTDVPRGPDDLAAILYTSGTTGRSKGAMLSHGNLASNAAALHDTWRFTAEDRLLHALPIFHTHGLFVATNVTLMAGSSLIFLPGFNADEIIRLLPKATVMMGVPTFYTRLLARPEFTRELVAHMRLFVSGSAPLSAETHKEFEARTGHKILERYGMTETNMNISNPYDGDRIPGSVGLPLPGVAIRIADSQTGQPLPQGEVGVIEIRGPNVFKGYWRMPEKTKEEFREDGFFISGDLGYIDANGYTYIVGRAKDLIISGGYNVYPPRSRQPLRQSPVLLSAR